MNKRSNSTLVLSILFIGALLTGGWISLQMRNDMQALNHQLTTITQSIQNAPVVATQQTTENPALSVESNISENQAFYQWKVDSLEDAVSALTAQISQLSARLERTAAVEPLGIAEQNTDYLPQASAPAEAIQPAMKKSSRYWKAPCAILNSKIRYGQQTPNPKLNPVFQYAYTEHHRFVCG